MSIVCRQTDEEEEIICIVLVFQFFPPVKTAFFFFADLCRTTVVRLVFLFLLDLTIVFCFYCSGH